MNEDKHINYSAADIARYHNRQMTAKEMHALEKAALDDPFLADALEGYGHVAVNAADDMAILSKKLDEKIKNDGKVIPLRTRHAWVRIAAVFIIIAGAGAVAYQFIAGNNKQDVAVLEKSKENAVADTSKESKKTEAITPADTGKLPVSKKNQEEQSRDKDKVSSGESNDAKAKQKDTIVRQEETVARPNALTSEAEKKAPVSQPVEAKELNEVVTAPVKTDNQKAATGKVSRTTDNKEAALNRETAGDQSAKAKKTDKYSENNQANIFRGQVLDANHTPLPFANVTNTKDNVGTYTDVKGNFILVSPDSLLTVQVKSVGFENTNTQLQNNISSNAIVLQQDRTIPSTVLSNRKVNTERARRSTVVMEEPEPSDGWNNYDTYLANNINIPDNLKTENTTTAEVELSFDINKYGEPVNIKVEKSSCKECDAEAIRLLKEGPKWKKKKKRARVSIPF